MYPFLSSILWIHVPVCRSSSQANCTVVMDNMYTIEYKEECGRKYNKVSRHGGGV